MRKQSYIKTLIEENRGENNAETIMNLMKGMEFVTYLDTGRLTETEYDILVEIDQEEMIIQYCDAIKRVVREQL